MFHCTRTLSQINVFCSTMKIGFSGSFLSPLLSHRMVGLKSVSNFNSRSRLQKITVSLVAYPRDIYFDLVKDRATVFFFINSRDIRAFSRIKTNPVIDFLYI